VHVGIVGAGLSGLVAARALVAAGARVSLFDKGRTVGGRLATQGREQGGFDHGAQRFSARSDAFRAEVEAWRRDGLVAAIDTRGPGWLPVPSTNALAQGLARGLAVRCSARVTALSRRDHRWWLALEGAPDEGPFDVVLLTAPAPQSAALLAPHDAFMRELATITCDPCWALALACDASGPRWPEAIFTEPADDGPIELLVREGLKPGRTPDAALVRLVAHASVPFSRAHLEASADGVATRMLEGLRALPGLEGLRPRWSRAHRWRFARVAQALGEPCLFDAERGLGVAGDGMLGPRLEAAWESGRALAAQVLAG
jgi:predicted NAD/FAD-dependent oxidoreductase